jgi:hypothetical protein
MSEMEHRLNCWKQPISASSASFYGGSPSRTELYTTSIHSQNLLDDEEAMKAGSKFSDTGIEPADTTEPSDTNDRRIRFQLKWREWVKHSVAFIRRHWQTGHVQISLIVLIFAIMSIRKVMTYGLRARAITSAASDLARVALKL